MFLLSFFRKETFLVYLLKDLESYFESVPHLFSSCIDNFRLFVHEFTIYVQLFLIVTFSLTSCNALFPFLVYFCY
jgi:hypothetical protein